MKTTLVLIYLSCLPLVCCTQNNSQASLRDASKNPLIVFYHITEKSRSELAENLKKIDSFSPKLIAIETIFGELQLPHEDSILASLSQASTMLFYVLT